MRYILATVAATSLNIPPDDRQPPQVFTYIDKALGNYHFLCIMGDHLYFIASQ
jgi:hypothetical protein